jgi:hypothetical protein
MQPELTDAGLEFLLARAGLDLTAAEKAELKEVYARLAPFLERVRKPRGIMAEPAHTYGFATADLP